MFVGDKKCREKFKISLCRPILAEKPRGNANNASYRKGSLISHRSVPPCRRGTGETASGTSESRRGARGERRRGHRPML